MSATRSLNMRRMLIVCVAMLLVTVLPTRADSEKRPNILWLLGENIMHDPGSTSYFKGIRIKRLP